MNHDKKYNILLLADLGHHTGCLADHIRAITEHSPHHWYVENSLTCKVLHKLDLNMFDAIGFHYSIRPHHYYYLPKQLYRKIKAFNGLKFLFLQDEYRDVSTVEDCILDLGIKLFFTLVREENIAKAYPRLSGVTMVPILTGYVPDELCNLDAPPIKDRSLDIFYRSRVNEYWLGELAQDKVTIAEGFEKIAPKHNLKIDVSVREEDRIYGKAWFEKLASARAVLATESGASIWDYDGSIERLTRKYLHKHPRASFKETREAVLQPYEANIVCSALSPRIFEAAALRTPLIMFPGYYNGICQEDIHYLKLEKDFSNIDDIIVKLKDDSYLTKITTRAYDDLIASKQYAQHKLSAIVAYNIDANIYDQENRMFYSSEETARNLHKIKRKFYFLSLFYVASVEVKFIAHNAFKLVFDKRYSAKSKVLMLFKGAHRYLAYLIPRYFER